MKNTLETYFQDKALNQINLNDIDRFMKQQHDDITKEQCHLMINNYVEKAKRSASKKEAEEVARLSKEIKNCRDNEENLKIWKKKMSTLCD
ncbi:hypothetical protein BD560DRAFT_449151, partial [Blakeslea trispora]